MRLRDGVAAAVLAGLLLAAPPLTADDSPCTEQQRQEYLDMLQRRIGNNWRLPGNYRSLDCTVVVIQSFRGEVLDASVTDCTDPEVKRTIEDAAYLSSPLPLPSNDACFQREINIRVLRQLD